MPTFKIFSEPKIESSRLAQVEELIRTRRHAFETLADDISRYFQLGTGEIIDTIKRRLLMDLGEGTSSLLGESGLRRLLRGPAAFLWLAAQCLLSLLRPVRHPRQTVDVLLEYWGADNFVFYRDIIGHLKTRNIAVFSRKPLAEGYPSHIPVSYRPIDGLFSADAACAVLRALPAAWRHYTASGFNMMFAYLVILRKVARYRTDMEGMEAKVLLSSGDNYYGGVRYSVYKECGLGSLMLMQNALRGGLYAESFIYCDTYFGFGWQTVGQIGLRCHDFRAVGSLKTAIAMSKPRPQTVGYDIAFIEQIVSEDWPETFNRWAYGMVIDNLIRFSNEHGNIKILFVTRPSRVMKLQVAEEIDNKLLSGNIINSSGLDINSYDAILQSKIVVSYNSTMCFEACSVGIPFLYCNYDRLTFLPPEDKFGILCDASYDAFRDRIILLLAGGTEVESYVRTMSDRYLVGGKDIPSEIAVAVNAALVA